MLDWLIIGLTLIIVTLQVLAIVRMQRRIRRLVVTNDRLRDVNHQLRKNLFDERQERSE